MFVDGWAKYAFFSIIHWRFLYEKIKKKLSTSVWDSIIPLWNDYEVLYSYDINIHVNGDNLYLDHGLLFVLFIYACTRTCFRQIKCDTSLLRFILNNHWMECMSYAVRYAQSPYAIEGICMTRVSHPMIIVVVVVVVGALCCARAQAQ